MFRRLFPNEIIQFTIIRRRNADGKGGSRSFDVVI